MPDQTVHVIIRSRQGTIFEGEAKAVSSINGKGPFDILPGHTLFISLIERNITVRKVDNTIQQFRIDTGVLEVDANQVKIYLENYTPT